MKHNADTLIDESYSNIHLQLIMESEIDTYISAVN